MFETYTQGRRLRVASGVTAPGPVLQAYEFVKLYSPVNWNADTCSV